MALTQGSKTLYSDFNAVKTAVNNAYKTTKGSAPTWSNAPTGAGSLMKVASLTELNSLGSAANSSYTTSGCSGHNTTHNNGNESDTCYVFFCPINYTVYGSNNKCGGFIWLGRLFQQ